MYCNVQYIKLLIQMTQLEVVATSNSQKDDATSNISGSRDSILNIFLHFRSFLNIKNS